MKKEDYQNAVYVNNIEMMRNIDLLAGVSPWILMDFRSHRRHLRRIQKEKKQLEIKTKIIERSGYEEVMVVEEGAGGTSSDYNQIKDSVQTRMNYQ